jgi:hypothetical protein
MALTLSSPVSCLISGLNRSAQHFVEVYSEESQSLRSFAGVDLDADLFCPVQIEHTRKGQLSCGDIVAASGSCFRSFLAATAVRITEVNFHIRSPREGLVFGHLQPTLPRRRAPQGCGELTNLPVQCGHDSSRVFASHLYQGSKTRMALH